MVTIVKRDDVYILNHCARSLARNNVDPRHNYGQYSAEDVAATIAEAWRFPIIDSYRNPEDGSGHDLNLVTFVCVNRAAALGTTIGVIGSFASLIEPIPLEQVNDSDYWAVSVIVPKGQNHYYQFIADGRVMLDPINPQHILRQDGGEWSYFFTEYCTNLITLERWQADLLGRLTDHILPFRTTEGQRWLSRYHDQLDKGAREDQFMRAFQLDQSVGAVGFIDKILARQERHRLVDYEICLDLCYRLLRNWHPNSDPLKLPVDEFLRLYNQLANGTIGTIPGWDYGRYQNPRFFLQLLRRHTFTGAFSHPKYGGNAGAAGWQFLASNLVDPDTKQLPRLASVTTPACYFDWARAHEPPLGRNTEYHG
ncbi:gluconate 2-dehydrogenase subunit 3 family protein [Klebsiella pneumoniae]